MMNAIGEILTTGVPVLAAIAAIVFIALKFYRKTDDGLQRTDAAFLKIPVLGKIIFDSDICRFSNLASTLFASGVNTTETFRLSEKSLKNAQMRSRFQSFRTAVNDGAPISAALQRFNLLSEDIDVPVGTDQNPSGLGNQQSHTESPNKRIKIGTAAPASCLGTILLVFISQWG
ncbi:MAG: type II secretion system F family protein [Bacilli bacterium]